MAVPESVQQQLNLAQQELTQAEQQQTELQAEQQDYVDNLQLPVLAPSETQRSWMKKILAAENKVVWIQSGTGSVVVDEKGKDSSSNSHDNWETMRRNGFVRRMNSHGGVLEWGAAADGYSLVLPQAGQLAAKPESRFLQKIEEVIQMDFKGKRGFFQNMMKQMQVKWEDGQYV